MGGVDKSDQLLSYYGFSHRTVKWWRRAFFHLIDLAVVNSYILYCGSQQSGRRYTHEQFRIELAKGILMSVTVDCAEGMERVTGPAVRALPPQARLTERHFPGRVVQSNCVVCSGKKGRGRKTTTYKCQQCNLPMCVVPCFELYHTKVNPQIYLNI